MVLGESPIEFAQKRGKARGRDWTLIARVASV